MTLEEPKGKHLLNLNLPLLMVELATTLEEPKGETSAEPELTLADLLEETVKGNKLEGRFSISMSPVCL